MSKRPTVDEWAMNLAFITASRGTCYRRKVGCVLLDGDNHVLSTGYNGVAAGLPHCNESDESLYETFDDVLNHFPYVCTGACFKSGEGLDECQAIHAEQNALLQCSDVRTISTCYVTTSPCITCTKLLLNTGCQRIVFLDLYPHNEAEDLWVKSGRIWEQFKGFVVS
jgi:dCMP deaminase